MHIIGSGEMRIIGAGRCASTDPEDAHPSIRKTTARSRTMPIRIDPDPTIPLTLFRRQS
jgi:hypothetical protein